MGYSYHVQLRRGTLKIKSQSRLRSRERDREVPVCRLGWIYFVWERKAVTLPPSLSEPHNEKS